MTPRDLAQRLLRKAENDIAAFDKLRDSPDIATEILGFHAQQAAEKMLKAILAFHQIRYPFTHRLADLIDMLRDNGISFPDRFEDARFLTPFAVELRYDFLHSEDDNLDRDATFALLQEIHDWVIALVGLE